MSKTEDTVTPPQFDRIERFVDSGSGSRVYHEDDVEYMNSVHDGRSRKVLINDPLVGGAGGMLIDFVEFGPEVSSPEHYHDGTDHFFYVLEGEGAVDIEGDTHDVEEGTVLWIGEGDRHRVYCREGQDMRILEGFSNGDYETVYTSGDACTWTPEDD